MKLLVGNLRALREEQDGVERTSAPGGTPRAYSTHDFEIMGKRFQSHGFEVRRDHLRVV